MSPTPSTADWERLGEKLTRRRVRLDPRYANRTTFAAERGIDYRLAYDIEEARRANFRRTTLAGVAAAYAVTFDSLGAVLGDAAASLEALPGTPGADDAPARPGLVHLPPAEVPAVPLAPGGEEEDEEDEESMIRSIFFMRNPGTNVKVEWKYRREMIKSALAIGDRQAEAEAG